MGFKIVMQDNSADIIELVKKNKERALEAVGIQAEGDVKDEIEILEAKDTGRLQQSIAHAVHDDSVEVGTNVEYAVYVHEGTGRNTAGGNPYKRWVYTDPLDGKKRMVHPQKPRRYIKNAIIRYAKDYMSILAEYLFKRD